jgi:hypothetical protein
MENTPPEISISDPLSQVTRNERRSLLGFSALVIFVTQTGLIPTKIEALGVNFEPKDQASFLVVLGLILVYFTIAFLIYGSADYLAWKIKHDNAKAVTYRELEKQMSGGVRLEQKGFTADWIPTWPRKATFPVSISRAIFEFLFPVIVSVCAIYTLLSFQIQH